MTTRPRKYKPKFFRATQGDRLAPSRVAWSDTALGSTIIYIYRAWIKAEISDAELLGVAEPALDVLEEEATVRLYWRHPTLRRPLSHNLTALTAQELDCLQGVINLAIGIARPICEKRDANAKLAFEQGDDGNNRAYRRLGQFIVRPGKIAPYFEGIPRGSKTVSGDAFSDPNYRESGEGSDAMDGGDETGEGSTEDSPQETDEQL